ncbi:hypothetical protein ABH945_005837 [Paraburkholderia sp. GAS333]
MLNLLMDAVAAARESYSSAIENAKAPWWSRSTSSME